MPAAATTAATAAQFVLVDVGAVLMAVPVQHVVQGIAWPRKLDLLPRRGDKGSGGAAGASCGVFNYLGAALAMLDLSLWVDVGAGHGKRAWPRALIVRAGGCQVAIAVDAVRGLHKVAADAVTRISHDDNGEQIFHSVVRCAGIDGMANVLDVPRLMALAATWSGAPTATAAVQAAQAAPAGAAKRPAPRASYGIIDGDGCRIAFPVSDLLEVLPAPALEPFQSPLTEGLCRWRGRHLPVTSVFKCFPALAGAPRRPPSLLAVFERDGQALGMLIDQVPAIGSFDAHAGSEEQEAQHTVAVADAESSLVHLVGMAALYARFPERALSRADGAVTAAAAPHANTNPCSHIVFEADGVASTPIDGIEAVLPRPPLAPSATHMAWRGQAIVLRDLRKRESADGADGGGTVIVVSAGVAPVGFVVDAVRALVQPRAGRMSRLAMPGRGVVDLLTTGDGGAQITYSTRDLAQLARAPVQGG